MASPTAFWLTIVPATISMATIGLWSLVATLLWGRLAFGIPVSFDQPLVFVLAALVLAFSLGLVGFLQAVRPCATARPGRSDRSSSSRSG